MAAAVSGRTAPGAAPAGAPGLTAAAAPAIAADFGLYALLLALVWGLTAPLRGLWQDDASLLGIAVIRLRNGPATYLEAAGSPLRRLLEVPYLLAAATPHPVFALQALYGACWLGQALATGWIAGMLLPRRPLVRMLAVALTLTATSDYLTDNLTATGYNCAVLALLLALGCALHFVLRGGAGWLVGSAAALAASLWTVEVAVPALPFVPLLLVWRTGIRRWQRPLLLLLAWGAIVLPFGLLEWRFLHDPQSYAAVAMPSPGLRQLVFRGSATWLYNFTPWRWAWARPAWYARPPAVIAQGWMALAAAVAAAALALRARRLPPEPPPEPPLRMGALAALLVAMALVSNTAYSCLIFSFVYYRTHVLSRVWISVALAVAADWAAARWPRAGAAALAVPALFVGLGTWGGLERQDLFVATWRAHQRELLSIAANAPGLAPGTEVILRAAAVPEVYHATEADYLTHSWMRLLYRGQVHSLHLSAGRGTACVPAGQGLDCWREDQAGCRAAHTCAPDRFAYGRLIVMDYDEAAGVYRLRGSLAGDPLAAGAEAAAAAAYRPQLRIVRRPLTTAQRRLLLLN